MSKKQNRNSFNVRSTKKSFEALDHRITGLVQEFVKRKFGFTGSSVGLYLDAKGSSQRSDQ
jgi:hypothetical protein